MSTGSEERPSDSGGHQGMIDAAAARKIPEDLSLLEDQAA